MHQFMEIIVEVTPEGTSEFTMVILLQGGLPTEWRVAMEFPTALGNIYKSMSCILHILRDFDCPMKPVNLASNA